PGGGSLGRPRRWRAPTPGPLPAPEPGPSAARAPRPRRCRGPSRRPRATPAGPPAPPPATAPAARRRRWNGSGGRPGAAPQSGPSFPCLLEGAQRSELGQAGPLDPGDLGLGEAQAGGHLLLVASFPEAEPEDDPLPRGQALQRLGDHQPLGPGLFLLATGQGLAQEPVLPRRHRLIQRTGFPQGLQGLEGFVGLHPHLRGQLTQGGRAAQGLGQAGLGRLQAAAQRLQAATRPQPPLVLEESADRPHDEGDGVGGEAVAPVGIEALQGLQEPDGARLDQLLQVDPAPPEAAGDLADQGQVAQGQLLAGLPVARPGPPVEGRLLGGQLRAWGRPGHSRWTAAICGRLVKVTTVPCPGAEFTYRRSAYSLMKVKPRPRCSPGRVVKLASQARATSSIPRPWSATRTTSSPSGVTVASTRTGPGPSGYAWTTTLETASETATLLASSSSRVKSSREAKRATAARAKPTFSGRLGNSKWTVLATADAPCAITHLPPGTGPPRPPTRPPSSTSRTRPGATPGPLGASGGPPPPGPLGRHPPVELKEHPQARAVHKAEAAEVQDQMPPPPPPRQLGGEGVPDLMGRRQIQLACQPEDRARSPAVAEHLQTRGLCGYARHPQAPGSQRIRKAGHRLLPPLSEKYDEAYRPKRASTACRVTRQTRLPTPARATSWAATRETRPTSRPSRRTINSPTGWPACTGAAWGRRRTSRSGAAWLSRGKVT